MVDGIRLDEVLGVLARRAWVAVAVFVAVVAGTLAVAYASAPTYQAETTLLVTYGQDMLVPLLASDRYASDVAVHLGLAAADDAAAARAFAARVDVDGNAARAEDGLGKVAIRVSAASSDEARRIASAYADRLEAWRPFLDDLTRERLWSRYYEESGKNATNATLHVDTFVRNVHYATVLESGALRGASGPHLPTLAAVAAFAGAVLGVVAALGAEIVASNWRGRRTSS